MKIGAIVRERRTGKLARVLQKNGDWQVYIEYVNEKNEPLHPNAVAWVHPNTLEMGAENDDF